MPALTIPHAIQHTRAVLALTTLTGPLEVLQPAVVPGSALDRQMRKVLRWRDECAKLTKSKAFSAGARRDLESACSGLTPYMRTEHMDHESRLRRWAELYWAGVNFTLDVKSTCPQYGTSRAWIYLDMTAWTLGRMLMELAPGCDEGGTEIYMRTVQ